MSASASDADARNVRAWSCVHSSSLARARRGTRGMTCAEHEPAPAAHPLASQGSRRVRSEGLTSPEPCPGVAAFPVRRVRRRSFRLVLTSHSVSSCALAAPQAMEMTRRAIPATTIAMTVEDNAKAAIQRER